jgi:hypothetical protein
VVAEQRDPDGNWKLTMKIVRVSAAATLALMILGMNTFSVTAALSQQSAPMTNVEVDSYVQKHGHIAHQRQSLSVPSDPFAIPQATPPRATNVLLEFPFVRKTEDYQSGPNWRYDVTGNSLALSYFVSSMIGETPDWEGLEETMDLRIAKTASVNVFTSERVSSGGRRQNSYGARAEVSVKTTTTRGIMARAANFREQAQPNSDNYDYRHTVTIAPEAARALVNYLKVQVIARVVQWRPGDFVQCTSSYLAPTVRYPQEQVGNSCYLSTEIDAVRFVDSRDDTVIREWRK